MRSRQLRGFCLVFLVVALNAVAACSSAASVVTVGPTLPIPVAENFVISCGHCVVLNPTAPGLTSDVSPVDGIVLRWRIYRGAIASPIVNPGYIDPGYRLRVISRVGPQAYLGAGTSSTSIPASPTAVETFPVHLPIRAGQLIALELENSDSKINFGSSTAVTSSVFESPLEDGAIGTPSWEGELTFPFNADVLPRPSIDNVSPNKGSIAGGNEAVITGSNFAEVESVTIGGKQASFMVNSESQLMAVVPPNRMPTVAPVSVVTAAGSAEAPGGYTYKGCVVPRLKGRSLRRVRRMLSRNECKLGQIRGRHHVNTKFGRVKRQSPHPGAVLPPHGRVEVTLGFSPAYNGR
jgi:hypothetical protein